MLSVLKNGVNYAYPFGHMEVGQWFTFPVDVSSNHIHALMRYHGRMSNKARRGARYHLFTLRGRTRCVRTK